MLGENGWEFLLVDGGCVGWVLPSSGQPLVRTVLSADDERQLATSLKLSTWSAIVPPADGCADGPTNSFRFGEQRLIGSGCGSDAQSTWGQLNAAFSAQLERLASLGQLWGGDLHYLVLPEQNQTDPRPAVPWPLDTALSTVALPEDQLFNYHPGMSQRATGDDATKLRAIRTTSNIPSSDGLTHDFTRITDGSRTNYQLYIRDALPLEQENGLLPPSIF
ncbi:MAG TPA: hypothetical protein VIU64_22490 [Polyangia bacterium]